MAWARAASPPPASLKASEAPTWSPDSSEIAVGGYCEGAPGLYAVNVATGQVRTIIQTVGVPSGPDWR